MRKSDMCQKRLAVLARGDSSLGEMGIGALGSKFSFASRAVYHWLTEMIVLTVFNSIVVVHVDVLEYTLTVPPLTPRSHVIRKTIIQYIGSRTYIHTSNDKTRARSAGLNKLYS